MLPIDPDDGPGGYLGHAATPAQPLSDIVPLQAMANGGTIIRPGAVAWGSARDAGDGGSHLPGGRYSSCEAIERALAAVAANPEELPALLAELAASRLWVPLPTVRPFTDGTAVRLPLISHQGTDFVPCFTSVLRLTAWADQADAPEQRAGDPRTAPPVVVPHIVVPAAGLAERLPAGVGLALNPGSGPGVPLYRS